MYRPASVPKIVLSRNSPITMVITVQYPVPNLDQDGLRLAPSGWLEYASLATLCTHTI